MRIQLSLAALAGCLLIGSPSVAQDCCSPAPCCDESGTIRFGAELLYLEANRADGNSADFSDYEATPRIFLAYETAEQVGIRFRYFEFNNSYAAGQNGAPSSVDTSNIDLEIYRSLCLARSFELEVSGGIRYNDYRDQNFGDPGQRTQFAGVGGLLGLKATQDLGYGVQGYARGAWSYITDQSNDNGAVGFDANRAQQELGIGLESDFCVRGIAMTGRAGVEWQDWDGYQDDSDGSIGLQGFVLGLDAAY